MEHIEEICRMFQLSEAVSVKRLGDGHINDSYYVRTKDGTYICQCMNSTMDTGRLEYNYALYSGVFSEENLLYPVWMKDLSGRYFHKDKNGMTWRMYEFIDGDILTTPLTADELLACGQGLAHIHHILQRLPDIPHAVYPHLHDLAYYHKRYMDLLGSGNLLYEERDFETEEKINSGIEEMLATDLDGSFIVHGDAKLSNMVFRDGKVIAFVDLDTIMQGSLLEDIADCIRSCCIIDGSLNRKAAGILIDGYMSKAEGIISEEEIGGWPVALRKICFELGLRYYTDSISKDKIFKEKYPGYLLTRARQLLGS